MFFHGLHHGTQMRSTCVKSCFIIFPVLVLFLPESCGYNMHQKKFKKPLDVDRTCFSQCSNAVKKRGDSDNSDKRNHLIAAVYSFRGLVCHQHGREDGDTQAHMVLEKQLRVLHLNDQATGRESHWAYLRFQSPKAQPQ